MPLLYTLLCYAGILLLGFGGVVPSGPLPCHVTGVSLAVLGGFGILAQDMESLRADRAPLSDFNVAITPPDVRSSKTFLISSSDAGIRRSAGS